MALPERRDHEWKRRFLVRRNVRLEKRGWRRGDVLLSSTRGTDSQLTLLTITTTPLPTTDNFSHATDIYINYVPHDKKDSELGESELLSLPRASGSAGRL
ncbi:hypothetical protein AGIG_G1713 [Arapaima gigas]